MAVRVIASDMGRIYPPTAETRNWAARPRLLRALGGKGTASNEQVVLISAPAGAGKSVLARQWLDLDAREHLEIPLVPRLDEPVTLLRAVATALEGVGPPAEDLRSISIEEPGFSTLHLPRSRDWQRRELPTT